MNNPLSRFHHIGRGGRLISSTEARLQLRYLLRKELCSALLIVNRLYQTVTIAVLEYTPTIFIYRLTSV